ncbi:MAG: alpha/beta hydrolase-fold protein [Planctomycetaceae bacterium]
MNRYFRLLLMSAVVCLSGIASAQEEDYPTPPEAVERDGVPKGRIDGPHEFRSTIYPGTVRNYWVYVPAQYDAAKPAALMIVQDGLGKAKGWNLSTVLDNMIHSGEIPVQLGIFIDHGVVPAPHENAQPRFNRSFEYDSMGDRYARFLIEEILPEVAKTYSFSDDPNDRCIAGSSSGLSAHYRCMGTTGCVSSRLQHDRHIRRSARRE